MVHHKVTNRYSKTPKSFLYRIGASCMFLGLAITLVLQSYVLYLSQEGQSIVLPGEWVTKRFFRSQDYTFTADYIELNLRGDVYIDNPTLFHKSKYIFNADSCSFKLDFFQLLKGARGIREIILKHGTLSTESDPEPIFHSNIVHLQFNGKSLYIKEVNGEFAKLKWSYSFEEDLFLNFERFFSERLIRAPETKALDVNYYISKIKKWEPFIVDWINNHIEQGYFDVRLKRIDGQLVLIGLGSLQSNQNEISKDVTIPRLDWKLNAKLHPNRYQSQALFSIHIPNITYAQSSISNTRILYQYFENPDQINSLKFYSEKLTHSSIEASAYGTLFKELENDEQESLWKLNSRIYKEQTYLHLGTHYDAKTKRISIQSEVHVVDSFLSPILSKWKNPHLKHTLLELNKPIEACLNTEISLDELNLYKPPSFHGYLSGKSLIAYGVPLKNVRAQINWDDSGQVTIDNISTHDGTTDVTGLFFQDFNTWDYRILVKGQTFPTFINPWLDTLDFWEDLWEDIKFPNQVPFADFDIGGRWHDHHVRDIFGAIQSKEISYKTIPAKSGHAYLRSLPKYLEIYDLHAQRDEGSINGSMYWVFNPYEYDKLTSSSYNFISTIYYDNILHFLPDNLRDDLKQLNFSTAPWIQVTSKLFNEEAKNIPDLTPETYVNFTGRTLQPVTYYEVPLDHLALTGTWKDQHIDFPEMKIGIADGLANAKAMYHLDNREKPLDFTVSLENANREKLQKIFKNHNKTESTQSSATIEVSPVISEEQKISITLAAKTNPDNIASAMTGLGEFTLTGKELQMLNLLGPLSKLLAKTPIPFASIKFNKATGKFVINNNALDFSLFQMESASSRLDASGTYNLGNEALDFKAKLFLLGGLNIPIFKQILDAVNPIAHALEFKINGSLEEPGWRFVIDPRNIFKSSSTEEQKDDS